MARFADRLQRAVLAPRRHSFPLDDANGRRIASVPFDLAVGEEVVPGPGDVVLFAGTDWYHKDPKAIGAMKRRFGFRLAVICYDLIPFLYPEFFPASDVALFRAYWQQVLALADLIIFNSRRVEADARAIAADLGLFMRASAVTSLGFDPPARVQSPGSLPNSLIPGQFALFVSTVEPRKGHTVLLRLWRKLLLRGIPQRREFRLVFVGRPGWMVDDLLREIDTVSGDGTVLWLRKVGDAELDGLYRAAAFCLYPSRYEGFGLPLIEAFARGKAVIASTGGAIPETVGDLSPCLDLTDEAAWEQTLADWIERPEIPARYEARIRADFAHPNWAVAAAGILDLASRARDFAGGGAH
jgi:glycosyltransferase involved in cell wall biosynthesis